MKLPIFEDTPPTSCYSKKRLAQLASVQPNRWETDARYFRALHHFILHREQPDCHSLRASSVHIPIVRALRARRTAGCSRSPSLL